MTLQQMAASTIQIMPEDKLRILIRFADFLNRGNSIKIEEPSPSFFTAVAGNSEKSEKKPLRFGLGKGIITKVDEFDSFDEEIEEMFEEALL